MVRIGSDDALRRSHDTAAFRFKRKSRYYFRYCLPEQLQAVLSRCEIRVSLETNDATLARERVAVRLPQKFFRHSAVRCLPRECGL